MNSDKNDDMDVPAGWELCISKKNPSRRYYFNRKTGESSWTKPQAVKSPEENKCKRGKEEIHPKGKSSNDEKKKTLKRKSDGIITQSSTSKKFKEENASPEKRNYRKRASTGSIKAPPKFTPKPSESKTRSPLKKNLKPSPSPAKRARETAKTSRDPDQSPKPSPSKNAANARLCKLRAELSTDVNNEEAKETPRVTQTAKPTTPQTEKTQRQESHSNNESQSISHSPNETAQSAISPSQFIAANKIIYSMKAQLPDRDTLKPKDAFADIEEGINNQTTEYPFMKHPATPPQFSEARKLMSAINSKLSYRKETPIETSENIFKAETVHNAETPTSVYNVFKSDTPVTTYKFANMPMASRSTETTVGTFRTAQDRMETLRKRLSNEAMDTHVHTKIETAVESMDVDTRETKQVVPESRNVQEANNKVTVAKENVILVVDTNIFIHELDFIKNIMNSHIEGYTEQPTLLVPWRVINELDKLKDSNNGNGAICKRARPAMDYLYKSLPENNNRIKVQPLRDANSHIYPCESPDDEILNCCLQQAERGKAVILLSNDKNLCTKAATNGVETKTLRALILKPHSQSAATPLSAARLKKHIFTLLSNILENEMRAKYENLWMRIIFKPPPWSLSDVLQCLLKHWMAVFNEVFPRIEYLIMDLKNSLGVIDNKGSNTLTQSEVCNFKELCLEVAKRCQIIPEYMQLAKITVEKLQNDCASESEDESERDEAPVIDAFERVWTVFSSYCAKLASALAVVHTVEDKIPGKETLDTLTRKLSSFGNLISALANTMDGVLNEAANSPMFVENVERLERAFKSSLKEIGVESGVTNANIRMFCTKCRNMLQEAQEFNFLPGKIRTVDLSSMNGCCNLCLKVLGMGVDGFRKRG